MTEVSWADVDGLSVAYREQGVGPPLVLLHGWPLDSRLDNLDLAPAHVVGLSFGGGLALQLFRDHPDTVRSLILISAYAGWGGSLPPDEVEARLRLALRNSLLPPHEWTPALIDTLLPDGSDPELADELTAMLHDFHPVALRTALQAFAETDLRGTLPKVDVPTLLLYGELDVRSPAGVWEPIHAGIARSKLVVTPGVGHMVDMQAPERCNDEIRAFLQQIEPG